MWAILSRLVLKLAAIRWLFKLGGLAALLPIAFLLKVVGIPLLMILLVLGLPIIILLFLFGLPIFAVLLVGGMLMGLLGVVLTIGVAALKVGIFVVLPIWLMWRLVRWISCRSKGNDGNGGSDGASGDAGTAVPDPLDPADTDAGIDPAV